MNIGEKIKNLRLSKLMTQKELAGNEITRNMLSQIENGAAMPSLHTLIYLAGRLSVPVGYLVSDSGANEAFYRKYSDYSNIVASYKSGQWEICRDLCLSCMIDKDDNELTYMMANASMQLGISHFNDGNLRAAYKMFEEATEYSAVTIFETSGIISCITAYTKIMSMISPTLAIEIPANPIDTEMICNADICKYAHVLYGDESTGTIPEKDWKDQSYYYAANAIKLVLAKNYEAAIALLSHILEEDALPRPVMYFVLSDYEKCCKETNDYKNAYEISRSKMQLFEKLLADI
ncbi:MAG: helix-turn-helix transcriptional regulator [Clostridia bacterium]|nr:helix-turn-helix transcriptional regulator [Clostridia bacterium]